MVFRWWLHPQSRNIRTSLRCSPILGQGRYWRRNGKGWLGKPRLARNTGHTSGLQRVIPSEGSLPRQLDGCPCLDNRTWYHLCEHRYPSQRTCGCVDSSHIPVDASGSCTECQQLAVYHIRRRYCYCWIIELQSAQSIPTYIQLETQWNAHRLDADTWRTQPIFLALGRKQHRG